MNRLLECKNQLEYIFTQLPFTASWYSQLEKIESEFTEKDLEKILRLIIPKPCKSCELIKPEIQNNARLYCNECRKARKSMLINDKKLPYEDTCKKCDKIFTKYNKNRLYCDNCKRIIANQHHLNYYYRNHEKCKSDNRKASAKLRKENKELVNKYQRKYKKNIRPQITKCNYEMKPFLKKHPFTTKWYKKCSEIESKYSKVVINNALYDSIGRNLNKKIKDI